MEALQEILANYNIPILSAFILGVMTSISPCPLATNITATAYIAKNIADKRSVLLSGLLYALGRAFSYTLVALILFFGASKFHIARFLNQNGEKFLGPILIIIGLILLNVIRLDFMNKWGSTQGLAEKFQDKGLLGSFLIGILFALAFCPYSGVLYFGMLIPMTIVSPEGLYLPIIFAFGTALPVLFFTYILAFAATKINVFYSRIKAIEKGLRFVAGVVFIISGLYYILIFSGLITF